MNKYHPQDIEPKWQKTWADTHLYAAKDGDTTRPKYYMLTEFPYPSGDGLHAGHAREYTIGDVIARHKRMQGYNVLYPMGYDAFGLPTENYAIKHKIRPQDATVQNVANFRKQFEALGYSIDWAREVNTTDPDYYKWTQWLFLRFFKEGLAYQAEMAINWCPMEKTGLANEEVVNGLHERCGTPVEKKLLKQWMLGITKYADRLIEGLKTVDYPSRIADQQINWIGRSEGAEIDFTVQDVKITVYTTRPDTLAGATFLVLAPEHPAVAALTTKEQRADVEKYVAAAQRESEIARQNTDRPKTGVFTGAYTKNPITGEKMPIWIADYVLAGYGTGAIMAVPAHDDRDYEFAKTFSLPIERVIMGGDVPYAGEGLLTDSGQFDGLTSAKAKPAVTKWLYDQGLGRGATKYKLRDWIFSRQHYWGEPIPIVHCAKCGAVAVPDDQLPVTLPDVTHYEPTDDGKSPLAAIKDWVDTACPKCGGPAQRETDTMPNWAGSSWYYLRYMDSRNDQAFADRAKLDYWGSVDLYLGGMEHTTLHLLYSRFWHQFFYDQGLVPTPEPYAARRGQGIVLAADGRKMSKSLGNVINPIDIIARYGADAFRLYILFMAPYDETTPWSDERLGGTSRFLYRVWTLAQELIEPSTILPGSVGYEDQIGAFAVEADRATHKTLKKIHHDFDELRFNTAVSALMEHLNFLTQAGTKRRLLQANATDLRRRTLRTLILMLAPIVPHIAEELWRQTGEEGSVHVAAWPQYDPELIKDNVVTVVVQINGKVRAQLAMPAAATEAELTAAARADPKITAHLEGKTITKTIVVPRKLINFVVR
ncbi:MAG: leucine--tRNA ligase [Patescibacteria group bacterium]|nr:leucine--tRNA ligase [Patescibacteria group bacterium]